MNLFEVSYEVFAREWAKILPTLILGAVVAFWSLLVLWIGFRIGWKRGVNDSPAAVGKEMRQLRFNLAVAEERLNTQKKMTKQFENMVRDLTEVRTVRQVEVREKERIERLRIEQ